MRSVCWVAVGAVCAVLLAKGGRAGAGQHALCAGLLVTCLLAARRAVRHREQFGSMVGDALLPALDRLALASYPDRHDAEGGEPEEPEEVHLRDLAPSLGGERCLEYKRIADFMCVLRSNDPAAHARAVDALQGSLAWGPPAITQPSHNL